MPLREQLLDACCSFAPQDGFVHAGGFTRAVSFVDICLGESLHYLEVFGGRWVVDTVLASALSP